VRSETVVRVEQRMGRAFDIGDEAKEGEDFVAGVGCRKINGIRARGRRGV